MIPLIPILTTLAIAAAACFLFWRREALRGTTLTHAWWWVLLSLGTILFGELLLWLTFTDEQIAIWSPIVQLISATSTFCPMMAVLGARRPGHHAWQFVVATMWIMLALPAWEALFLGRPEAMDVGTVRGWFLWLMIAVNLITWLPTRFWMTSVLVMLGQLLMLEQFLPGLPGDNARGTSVMFATFFFATAVARTCSGFPRRRIGRSEMDQRWIQFRDMFGTMWALRVIERINAAAAMYRWPLSLTWTGFYFHDLEDDWKTLSAEDQKELEQTMENLLRRFM